MSEKLKPCPFCGAEAEIRGVTMTQINCTNDQCISRGAFNFYGHREDAIAAWNKRAQHAGEAEKPAEFEIRVGGIHMAGASGPRELALQEAQRYFRQYAFDATEDEPVQLVEVIEVAAAPVAAMSATPPAGER